MSIHIPSETAGAIHAAPDAAPTAAPKRTVRPPSTFDPTRLDRRLGAPLALLVAAAYGLGAGWWTPRGPVTTAEALIAIGTGLAVGAVAGVVMRSRWAALSAPVAFVVVFELVRSATAGPFVDGIHLTSTYGFIAFALGRGLHGVLTLAPMLLGALLGAATARRRNGAPPARHGWSRTGHRVRRIGTAVLALSLVVLTAGIIRPARTDPVAGGVAELSRVTIGGHELAIMIRANSVDSPVLLHLAGGPGGTDIGAMRRHGQQLERSFVVATFDQRGTGKSYGSLEPTSTLTLDTAISDTVEVINHLRARFHQDKIYIVGNSWGSLLGVLVAQRHPELVRAFIGAGQMVSPRDTDRIFYDDTLAWARSTGNSALVERLTASGPPPYTDMLDYESALTYEHQVYPYDDTVVAEPAGGFTSNLFVGEYTLIEQLHNLAGFFDVFTVLYPQLQNIDLRTQVRQLNVPVYLVQGRYEARGRSEPADEWFQLLDAPIKTKVVFELSGHRALFQQPELFHQVMTGTVLKQT
jgi:proline iminopeptidase